VSIFGRKPQSNSPAMPTNGQLDPPISNRLADKPLPHSRPDEHASEAPRCADLGFCYSDDQE
jgi:hypothetical protein